MILSAARFEESSPLAKSTRHIYGKCKISQQNCVACRSGRSRISVSSFIVHESAKEKKKKSCLKKYDFKVFSIFCCWSMDVV